MSGAVLDDELGLLEKILALLDEELFNVKSSIEKSQDPESDGLLDLGEFLIGSGFIAVQRYLNATRADIGMSRDDAYRKQPMFNEGISMARAINAIANYWKHCSDWDEDERNGRRPSETKPSKWTIADLERMGDLSDYPCSNALASMSPRNDLALSNLVSVLIEWREELWAARSSPAE
ncbi:hypothetical protein CVM50_12140 [Pseudooceanicola marinus]|nr:hypothetical protein CVM50_12140 [Pseudooceanicola marinus]